MDQQGSEKPWQQEESEDFVSELNDKAWKIDRQLDILILQTACPICTHSDGISATVPTRIARFRGADQRRTQFVDCKCAEPHPGRPTGQVGCGRWGMVIIEKTEG